MTSHTETHQTDTNVEPFAFDTDRQARIIANALNGACSVRTVTRGTIHSFGSGMPILLARNPLQVGARKAPAAAVLPHG